jgi:hypothetical protein
MADSREAAVRAATQSWLEAAVRADTDALDGMLTADYSFTHATTAITDSRAEWLEAFRNGSRRYNFWNISDTEVRLYPGAAVMVGHGHQQVVRGNGTFDLFTSFANTWIEDNGTWRCAVWQATLVPSK